MKGAASTASLTSLLMFSMTTTVRRLSSVVRSLSPRASKGTSTDSVDDVTVCKSRFSHTSARCQLRYNLRRPSEK